MHYTVTNAEETALEVDRVGDQGLQTTEGVVARDRSTPQADHNQVEQRQEGGDAAHADRGGRGVAGSR